MIYRIAAVAVVAVALLTSGGCSTPKGETIADQRTSVLQMRQEALNRLYAEKPGLREHVAAAPGYAVFSNYGLKILVAGGGNGYGVLHDNATGQDTFMRMAEINVGLGIGAKDFRAVFVFNKPEVMQTFLSRGWEFGADAEAGAKLRNDGAEVGASRSVQDMEIYLITKTGIALQATVGGTRYWKDDKLNTTPATSHNPPLSAR